MHGAAQRGVRLINSAESLRLPARSAQRLASATAELRRVLDAATEETQLAGLAVRCVARLADVPVASVWSANASGFQRAAVCGDPQLEDALGPASLCQAVADQTVIRRGSKHAYLGVAIRLEDQVPGVLSVLRTGKPFTMSEALLVLALADVLAVSQARARTQEIAAEHAKTEHWNADQQLRSIYEAIACGVTVWSPDGTLLHYNETAEELMGISLAEQVGRHLVGTVRVVRDDGTEAPLAERRVLTAARTGRAIRNYTSTITRADGETRFLQMNAVPVFGPEGRTSQVVCSFVDFTERKRAEEQLAHQAHHDPLTGLANRKLLIDRLEQAIRSAQQTETTAALLLVDLDQFKEVNDTRGHHVGDELLIQIGVRWSASMRARDTFARLGGDEFAVVLPDGDPRAARAVCHTLRAALETRFAVEGEPISVGASIGTAIYPAHGLDAGALLRHADVAMYRDKRRRTSARSLRAS